MAPAAAPTPAPMRAPFPAPYPVPAPTAAPAPPPTAAPVAVPHPLAARASSDPATTVRMMLMCRCIVLSSRVFFMDSFGHVGSPGAPTPVWRPPSARPSRCRPTRARAGSARPLIASLGRRQATLRREDQIVLHGADTRNSAGNLGGPGARVDRLDLTRESDHARVHLGVDFRVLQLRILLEAVLDALRSEEHTSELQSLRHLV